MHIDHSKLVELLVETSGIEKEKVEAQLKELADEIKAAIEEGDAYEVDGLGVFSGIGNNVIFIPSDELSTEINYKYVGMEPIEMDEASSREDDTPEASPPSPEETTADEEDPFAGLLDDVNDTEEPSQERSFELDMEEDAPDDETGEEEAPFDLGDEGEADAELEEEKPGPDKWGIDTYKDDTAETMFSGLLGKQDESEEDEEQSPEEDHFNALFEQESEEESDDSLLNEFTNADDDPDVKEEEGPTSDSDDNEEDEEDFDDPFEALAAEAEDEDEEEDENDDGIADTDEPTSSQKEPEEAEEVIPVIKNLSSEGAKKKKSKEEKEQPSEPKMNKKPFKNPSEPKSQPVMLWVILLILILGGATYALGYFGIVNIPGVTPQQQVASTTTPVTPPVTQQPESPPQEQQTEAQGPQNEATVEDAQAEPPAEEPVRDQEQEPASEVTNNREAPANQPTYGMTGIPVSEANDGFTIVIYSLSRESSAKARQTELSEEGYRVLLAAVPSRQYGTLWRVSLGQFRTMTDAALAAEELEPPFSENYFITKIQ